MSRVQREQIVDYETYEDTREAFREEVMAHKVRRRIHVGDHLTFLFETPLTVRYQIQEMMRAERIVRDQEIQHEIDTYNELLGEPGELGCTLLIEIDGAEERARRLREWIELPHHLYAELDDGSKVRPRFDPRQIGEGRLSSVQYLRFPVEGRVPVAIGSDLPALTVETRLSDDQRAALAEDLGG